MMPVHDAGNRPAHIAAFPGWANLSYSSKQVFIAGAALLLVIIATVSPAIWNMRVIALDETREDIKNLGIATTEQTFRSIQGIDLALQATQKAVLNNGPTNTTEFKTINTASGTFLGLAPGEIDLRYFDDFYKKLVNDNNLSILLPDQPDIPFDAAPISGGAIGVVKQASAWYGMAGSGPPGVGNAWQPGSPRGQIITLNRVAEYPTWRLDQYT
jgi:hypothetical protein